MGQKINPISFRTGIVRGWQSRWYFSGRSGSGRNLRTAFQACLEEDEAVRKVIYQKISLSGIAAIEIERTSNTLRVLVRAARPGLIIGKGGKGIEELTKAIEKAVRQVRHMPTGTLGLSVNIEEIKRTEISAQYVAQQIAWDLEKRMPFRQVMRKQLEAVVQNREVKGAKILLSGRLDGNEISRREWKMHGSLPLQTLRADIDFGQATAFCSYGAIGVKVWVYRGELFQKKSKMKNQK